MSVIPLISILILLVALVWSSVVLRRLRDRRMGFYSVMLALMVATQIFASVNLTDQAIGPIAGRWFDVPGLATSVMALLGVFILEGLLRRSDDERSEPVMPNRIANTAVLVGAVTILACFGLGFWAYDESRAGMKRAIAEGNLSLARRLGNHALAHFNSSSPELRTRARSELVRLWDETEPLYPGSYLCFVEQPGFLVLHSSRPEAVGRDVGNVTIPLASGAPITVSELIAEERDWAGVNRNSRGLPQIVGYASFAELGGAVVVHTPLRLVEADLRAAAIPWIVGLALTGGLLVPLLIGLLHSSYTAAQRSYVLTEGKRAQLENELRHSQKMEAVGRLAGGVAHDFNNMLTAVFGNVELARMNLDERLIPDARQSLDEIERAVRRAAELTQQLLAFSRKEDIRLETLDLNRSLSDVQNMLRRLIGEDIKLELDLARDVPLVHGDSGLIEQILLNLAINARDAMPRGGTLRVRTGRVTLDPDTYPGSKGGPHALLEVSDSGSGMSQQVVERIFEPFFTTKDQGKGTGLGLSMVYGIVQKLGGWIHVDSETGRGSTFTVQLPASTGKVALPGIDAPVESRRGNGETVLVCEDDDAVRKLICGVLENAGYQVIASDNGAQAIELAHGHVSPIQLLVTDVILPETNGRVVAQTLQQESDDLKVLYISGYTGDVADDRFFESDEVELLTKPFSSAALLNRVDTLLQA